MKIFKDFSTDNENGISLYSFIVDKYHIGIELHENDGKYSLWWTDFVANDYTETYDSLPVALAGLAVLLACGDSDWERFFKHDNQDFSVLAQDFINSAC
jgi:hypothetical protein